MKKILVVDNHPMVLRLLCDFLVKGGHEVRTAEDGLSAIEVLKSFVPDIIFVDLVMPNISGEKLCRVIRRMDHLRGVYLVILSDIAAEEQIDVTAFGANVCIAKGSFNNIARHVATTMELANAPGNQDQQQSILGVEEVYQREITNKLLSSRRHFEVILNNMSEGIIETTPEGKVIFVNPQAAAFLHAPEEELLAREVLDLFDAQFRVPIGKVFLAVENEPVSLDDNKYPLEMGGRQVGLTFYPVHDQDNGSVIIMIRDVSEYKKSQTKIQVQRDFLDKVLESMQHPFYVTSAKDYLIVHANRVAQQTLGLIPGKSRCFHVVESCDEPCTGQRQFCPTKEVRESKAAITVEQQCRNKAGQLVCHEVHAFPIFDDHGEVDQVILYLLDVSERRKNQDALFSSAAKLQNALDELKQAQAVLVRQAKLASIGTLASGVAHEILNPLNIIGTIVQILQLEELPTEQQEQLAEIMIQIRRATKITDNLRMFSRQHDAEIGEVDVNTLFDKTSGLIEHDLNLDNILIERFYDPNLPLIEADDDQLAQVFFNLLRNSRDALEGRDDKRIMITTSHQDGEVVIRFADTGSGIPQAQLDKIFDPFFTTKDPGHGTGLGLSIVYSVVEAHGGSIEVHSQEGGGTEFVLHLPVQRKRTAD